ncbi:YdcF family protein [Pelagibius marinus]|uniref:YdcF family protein n=1 Tax=Pelagibius marinus TaxID=2762760 RepID=UPI0018724B73|nr:YdcF family protein [Pelagibius marinus]
MRSLRQDRAKASGHGWRRLRRLVVVTLLLTLAYGIGFLWFTTLMPTQVDDGRRQTDAIVVLTGGSDRLGVALDLLSAKMGRKLFVSGVYHGVDVRQLLDLSQHSPEDLSCCVVLGYEADNTRGNAVETAAWMKEQGFTSLRLVTATYHMPRSLLEFRRFMPDIEVVPHPVFPEHFRSDDWWLWPGSSSLLITEYSKYLVALVRGLFDPLFAVLA